MDYLEGKKKTMSEPRKNRTSDQPFQLWHGDEEVSFIPPPLAL